MLSLCDVKVDTHLPLHASFFGASYRHHSSTVFQNQFQASFMSSTICIQNMLNSTIKILHFTWLDVGSWTFSYKLEYYLVSWTARPRGKPTPPRIVYNYAAQLKCSIFLIHPSLHDHSRNHTGTIWKTKPCMTALKPALSRIHLAFWQLNGSKTSIEYDDPSLRTKHLMAALWADASKSYKNRLQVPVTCHNDPYRLNKQ